MNIGIVTVWADCGAGYVSMAYQQVLAGSHKVFIYARGTYASGRGDPFWDTPDVTWDAGAGLTRVDWVRYRRWLRQNKIELVLFNEQRAWDVIIRTRKLGVLTAAYVDYYTAQMIELFDLYDLLICNTQRHFSVFSHHKQTWHVPWGADCVLFSPGERWGKPQETIMFFHSAGLGGPNDRKGTGATLEAFQHVRGPAALIIHSQLPLGQLPEIWQNWIAGDSRIRLVGGTVKPPGYYHLGDVYVYPSRLEGIGLTIVEAMACGLPVITTDNGPMNEFVEHGRTGTLVPVEAYLARWDGYYWPESPCRVGALTQAMQNYVDNPGLVIEQQKMARQYAETCRSWMVNAQLLPDRIKAAKRIDLTLEQMSRLVRLARQIDTQNEPTPGLLIERAAKVFARSWERRLRHWMQKG